MTTNPPADHPPIDWTNWKPAGDGDVRSPCPMINALANHSILPHSGKGLTKEIVVKALTTSILLDSKIANTFASVALTSNPDHHTSSFNLDHLAKHGLIEHDVSLSRDDFAFGDNHTFNKDIWAKYLTTYGSSEKTSFATASKGRWERVQASKKKHEELKKPFEYGIKEFILSYGETALIMAFMGDPKGGEVKVEHLKILFEQERLPFAEGWRAPTRPITQTDMNHLIFSLVKANEHKAEEASEVGLGTVHAVTAAVTSILPSYCTIM